MATKAQSKGTWLHRFVIRFFTVVFAILIFWVLGFFVNDIRSMRGPDYMAVEKKYISKEIAAKRDNLERQIADLTEQIQNQSERQRVLGDSTTNLQRTINQLLDLQRLGMQKNMPFSDKQQADLTSSLNLFLDNQKKYQTLSQTVSDMTEKKQQLVRDKEKAEQEIEKQRQPAREEFERLSRKHRLKLAFFQLAILLPILAIATFLVIKKHTSIYFPLFLAWAAATLVKVGLVVHECFPSRYFKYVLIGGLLIVVARLLVYFIRTIAFPKTQWLVKQYREAYERFLCPVCEYPIRTGPRRFLFWTRRTVNKIVVPTDRAEGEEFYTCPSCGTGLFEECPSCHKTRHSMLPHCSHCGAEKEVR